MKVLNCFKIVPDLDRVAEDDWSSATEDGLIDTSYIKSIINYYDESALELTCRFADRSVSVGVPCTTAAVTVGGKVCDGTLMTLAAVGYGVTDRIEGTEEQIFEPELIASELAGYIASKGPYDIISMGMESADGNNGRTQYILSELLEIPCISQVIGYEPVSAQWCRVTHMTDSGQCTEVIRLPVILAVGDVPSAYLRVPTLKQRMETSGQALEVYSAESMNKKYDGESVVLDSIKITDQSRAGVIIEGRDAREKAQKLYNNYLKGMIERHEV